MRSVHVCFVLAIAAACGCGRPQPSADVREDARPPYGGDFTLTDQDFADLTGIVLEVAREHAGGRVVSVIEGGYALDGLPPAVTSHLTRLAS